MSVLIKLVEVDQSVVRFIYFQPETQYQRSFLRQQSLSVRVNVFITGEDSPKSVVRETDVGKTEEEGTEFIPRDSNTFLKSRQFVVQYLVPGV